MYKFILRNETFHRTNRFILLISIVASLLLPAINWDLTGMNVTETVLDRTQEATALLNNIVVKPTMHNRNTFLRLSTAEIILALYFTGVACICVKNASTILHIKRIITRSKKSVTQNGKRLYISREKTPSFSWMGKIVVSEDDIALDCNRYIIWHEEAHASLGHYIDLAITEVFVCILWFWPSAWVLKRYLKEVHEYEADEAVLLQSADLDDVNELVQLLLHLLHHAVAAVHDNGDAGDGGVVGDPHRQGVDVEGPAGEQPGDPVQHAGLVLHQHGNGLLHSLSSLF